VHERVTRVNCQDISVGIEKTEFDFFLKKYAASSSTLRYVTDS